MRMAALCDGKRKKMLETAREPKAAHNTPSHISIRCRRGCRGLVEQARLIFKCDGTWDGRCRRDIRCSRIRRRQTGALESYWPEDGTGRPPTSSPCERQTQWCTGNRRGRIVAGPRQKKDPAKGFEVGHVPWQTETWHHLMRARIPAAMSPSTTLEAQARPNRAQPASARLRR